MITRVRPAVKIPIQPCLLLVALVLLGACREAPEVAARRYYERGLEHARQGRYAEAILEYRNALRLTPRDGETHYALSEAYGRTGEPERSGSAFARAAEFLPERLDIQVRLGYLLLNEGQFENARLSARHVLERDARNVDALMLLASAMAGLRQMDRAIGDIEEAIRSQPGEARLYAHLGNLQLVRGQQEEAEATFRRAIAMDPSAVAPHLGLANFYWAAGRLPEAASELLAALAIEPSGAIANRALARLYVSMGQPREAEARLLQWAATGQPAGQLALADFLAGTNQVQRARQRSSTMDATALAPVVASRLALLDLAAGDTPRAEGRLTAALQASPRQQELLEPLAHLLLTTGRLAEARTHIDTLLEAHPASAAGWLLRGRLLREEGDLDGATKALRQAVRLNPRLLDAHLGLFSIAETLGDAESAVQHAREAVSAWPGHPGAHLALSRAYTLRRNYDTARQETQAALRLLPDWPPALVQLGVIATAEGKPAEARARFEQVLARSPDNLDALAGVVQAALAQHRPDAAATLVAKRLQARPDDPTLLMLAARIARSRGDLPRAEQALRRVIEVAPDTFSAYEELGGLYAAQQRHADARREFEAVAARRPRPVGPLTMIGFSYEAEGRLEEARQSYERALAIDPNAGVAANNLAWILAQRDETLADALGIATSAQRLLPRAPEALDTLGWVHYRQGSAQVAISWFERAVHIAPAEPVYRYHLALALQQDGRAADARSAVQQALQSGKSFAGEADARRLLESLGGASAPEAPRQKR